MKGKWKRCSWNAYSPHHEGSLYFNHVTQEFTPGPTPLEDRRGHASGTITDQETGERIVVIAGGKSSYYLDTTELLFNGEWHAGKNQHTLDPRITFFKIQIFFAQSGPALPRLLIHHAMVEIGGNLYIFGGYVPDGGNYQTKIYKLTCASRNCILTTLEQQMKVARGYLVLIPVDDSFCTPNWNTKDAVIQSADSNISTAFLKRNRYVSLKYMNILYRSVRGHN